MSALFWFATVGLLSFTNGIPMPQSQPRSQSLVPGVFIPADAFKNLQDRANANDRNSQQVNTNQYQPAPQPSTNQVYQPQPSTNQVYQPQPSTSQVYQPQPSTSQVYQPQPNTNQVYQPQPSTNTYQPNTNIQNPQPTYQPQYTTVYQPPAQPPVSNQPVITVQPQPSNQPIVTNQAQPMVADRIPAPNSNQPIVLTSQPSQQPGQQVIYVQQPLPSTQTILVPQSSQPPQGYVLQNGQGNVIIPNNANQAPNTGGSGTVYTIIPLNNQNSNSNSGSYLIPIQPNNSNSIVLGSGK